MSVRILAIECSSPICSIALLESGTIITAVAQPSTKHDLTALQMLDRLRADYDFTRLDAIAFGQGPGAFTGVRIACAIVQALAFAQDLPVFGVSTLQALSYQAHRLFPHPSFILAIIDARMQQIYTATYDVRGKIPQLEAAEQLCFPEKLFGRGKIFGNGWEYRTRFPHTYHRNVLLAENRYPHATDIAQLSWPRWCAGERTPACGAQPVYIRNRVTQ